MSDKVIEDAVALQDTAAVGRGLDASPNLRKLLCTAQCAASRTVTLWPFRRSAMAAPSPASPAPQMMTWKGILQDASFAKLGGPFFPLLLSDMICLSAVENATVAIEVVHFDVQLNQHAKGGTQDAKRLFSTLECFGMLASPSHPWTSSSSRGRLVRSASPAFDRPLEAGASGGFA